MNYYKYGITPKELKQVRKFIIEDIHSNNKVSNPIQNMNLQTYFDIIKECMLAFIDEDGVVRDAFGKSWGSSRRIVDIRKLPSKDIAEAWMDGRGLFTKHYNNPLSKNYGDWPDITSNTQNQWYHEDRLNDLLWFKQCTQCGIGACGHPCENIMISNIYPVMFEEDKWYIEFGTRASDYGVLKAYLRLKEIKVPCFIWGAQRYLTNKQIGSLVEEGYLIKKDYHTGYYLDK